VRFYLDEDVVPEVAVIARALGLDVVSAHERNERKTADREVLRIAALDGRCVVTRNRDHFIHWTRVYFENEWPHAGVLVVPYSLPNKDPARIARSLVASVRSHEGGIPSYTLDWLSSR
jgi:hypothetical protein